MKRTSFVRIGRLEAESDIRRLNHEYCHGADKRDKDRFAAIWAAHAVWVVGPSQQFEGVDAICDAVAWQWATFPQMHHWTTNHVVTLAPDWNSAVGEADVSVTLQFPGGDWLRGGGVYRDEYIRTPVGWRISRREAEHLFNLDPVPPLGPVAVDVETPPAED